MARFKIEIIKSGFKNGIQFEKGMSVEVIVLYNSNPVIQDGGKEVQNAFLRIYGIDLKKNGLLNLGYLSATKID
jgi:hypothetical protein